MTVKERITQARKSENAWNPETVDGLINLAYEIGREQGLKTGYDSRNKILAEQFERAHKCRYWKLAENIIGAENAQLAIYYRMGSHYAQDILDTFGDAETHLY